MKLFLAIALIALIAVIVLAMQRRGTSVTTIETHREKDDDDA
jgi:aerobic-type carbon monoxide dehydrogenase small subunit (CoxS/CutS family)